MSERPAELERLDYWLKCEGGLAPESSNHLLIRSPGIYAPGAPEPTLGDLRWHVAEIRRLQRDLQTIVASASHVGLGKTPGEIADRCIRAVSTIIDQREEIDELHDQLAAAVAGLEPFAELGRNPQLERYVIDGEERRPALKQTVPIEACRRAALLAPKETSNG